MTRNSFISIRSFYFQRSLLDIPTGTLTLRQARRLWKRASEKARNTK